MMADSDTDLQGQRSPYFNQNKSVHREETRDLARKARVLCCIMTQPENHKTKVRVIKEKGNK